MSNSKENKKVTKVTNKRASSLKIFSVSSVVIFLAIVLVLNILLSLTIEDKAEIDLSAASQNSISDVSLDYIKSLPSDTNIRIVGLFDLTSPLPTHLEYTVPMLENLAAKSDGKISVEYINPDNDPVVVKELDPNGVADLTKGMYAVSCNGKVRLFDPYNDCFVFDPSIRERYGVDYPLSNIAESTVMSTIVSVTSNCGFKVYYLTGLQEASHLYLDKIFASMNIETAELSVAEPFVVPNDCSLLIINNPAVDISENVQEGLRAYIRNNVRPVNIICSLGIIDSENVFENYEHINNVLSEVNLSIANNCIIDNSLDYVINAETFDYKGALTDNFAGLNSVGLVRYQLSRNVVEISRASSMIASEPIIISSENTALLDLHTNNVVDVSNANVGAIGYYVGTDVPVNVVVFGSTTFTSDSYFQANPSASDPNAQMIRKLISSLVTSEVNMDIPAKSISDYSIDITKISSNTTSVVSVVFIAVIPITMVIIAAIVYNKRSHL